MRRFLVFLLSCSSPQEPPCIARFSGNLTETGATDRCATIEAGTLRVAVRGARVRLDVSIDLASPETHWSAFAARADDTNCLYSGGSNAVPAGDLRLESASGLHGTLTITLALHAPAPALGAKAIDCGPGDQERVTVEF